MKKVDQFRPQPSSISTERTFEEWFEIYSRRVVDNGATPISPMERSVARAAWAAAKVEGETHD